MIDSLDTRGIRRATGKRSNFMLTYCFLPHQMHSNWAFHDASAKLSTIMKVLEWIAGLVAVIACMAFYAWLRRGIRWSGLR
jgi:hypothetical protein